MQAQQVTTQTHAEDTYDKVYLLSYQVVRNIYFSADNDTSKSKHMQEQKVKIYSYDYSNWWLRSPNISGTIKAYHVDNYGTLNDLENIERDDYGVRPVLKIKID